MTDYHRKNFANQCIACAKPWPCDRPGERVPPTCALIARADKAEAALDAEHRCHLNDVDQLSERVIAAEAQRDAARALADGLGLAVRSYRARRLDPEASVRDIALAWDDVESALAKWEASRG